MGRIWMIAGALLGAGFVILGAVLQHVVGADADMMVILSKAQHYHMLHLVALLLTGWFLLQSGGGAGGLYPKLLNIAAALFLTGILLFSGNLYLKAVSSSAYMVSLVPVGGTMFIAGWLVLAAAFVFMPKGK